MLEVLFGGVVAVAMPIRAWRRHRRDAPPAPAGPYVAETLLLTGVLGALLWWRDVPLRAVGLRPDGPLGLLRDVAACVAVVIGIDLWSVWRITRRIRRTGAVPAPAGVFADALAGRRAIASFVTVTIVGAAWEELCFRGAVFLLVPRTAGGLLLGVLGGAVVFGLQHLRNGSTGFLYASFFGVLFSLLYLATGDLIAVIVAHAAGNIFAALQWAPRIERARREALARAPIFLG